MRPFIPGHANFLPFGINFVVCGNLTPLAISEGSLTKVRLT